MNAPYNWFGGKSRLAKKIIPLFPEHTCYVEVFLGGGSVFFRKESSKVEVINDKENEVVNFFRVIQNHYEEFLKGFEKILISRKQYQDFKKQGTANLTDIQRAVRFLYLTKLSFHGLLKPANYRYHVQRKPSLNLEKLPEIIKQVHQRLSNVNIESLDFEDCLKRYDRDFTLFYIDPPYWGINEYTISFDEQDHFRLYNALRNVKGNFILSLNDVPEVRNLYKNFHILDIQNYYPLAKTKQVNELLICNYDPTAKDVALRLAA